MGLLVMVSFFFFFSGFSVFKCWDVFQFTSYYVFQTFVKKTFVEFFLSKKSVLNFILPEHTSLSSFKHFATSFLVLAFTLLQFLVLHDQSRHS